MWSLSLADEFWQSSQMSRTSASQRSSALVRAAEHHSRNTERQGDERISVHARYIFRPSDVVEKAVLCCALLRCCNATTTTPKGGMLLHSS